MNEGSRRYSRRLSKAESELWSSVTADVRPIQRRNAQEVVLSHPDEQKKNPTETAQNSSKKIIHEQEKQFKSVAPIQDIDYRTHAKIRRGRIICSNSSRGSLSGRYLTGSARLRASNF